MQKSLIGVAAYDGMEIVLSVELPLKIRMSFYGNRTILGQSGTALRNVLLQPVLSQTVIKYHKEKARRSWPL